MSTRKKPKTKRAYVSRPSQITKRAPTKRLKRRRAKNVAKPRKGFFPNPAPIKYVIAASRANGRGPRMFYDGKNFSQRTPMLFLTVKEASTKARALIKQFNILHDYRVGVEHAPRPR